MAVVLTRVVAYKGRESKYEYAHLEECIKLKTPLHLFLLACLPYSWASRHMVGWPPPGHPHSRLLVPAAN